MPDDVPPGPRADALAQQRIQAFAATYAKTYPAAARCLLDDAQALTVYLRFPAEHGHRIRHSNFIWVNRPMGTRLSRRGASLPQPGALWVHPEPGRGPWR